MSPPKMDLEKTQVCHIPPNWPIKTSRNSSIGSTSKFLNSDDVIARSPSPNFFDSDYEENNTEDYIPETLDAGANPLVEKQLRSSIVANNKHKSNPAQKSISFRSSNAEESSKKFNLDIPTPECDFITLPDVEKIKSANEIFEIIKINHKRRKLLLEGSSDEDDDLNNYKRNEIKTEVKEGISKKLGIATWISQSQCKEEISDDIGEHEFKSSISKAKYHSLESPKYMEPTSMNKTKNKNNHQNKTPKDIKLKNKSSYAAYSILKRTNSTKKREMLKNTKVSARDKKTTTVKLNSPIMSNNGLNKTDYDIDDLEHSKVCLNPLKSAIGNHVNISLSNKKNTHISNSGKENLNDRDLKEMQWFHITKNSPLKTYSKIRSTPKLLKTDDIFLQIEKPNASNEDDCNLDPTQSFIHSKAMTVSDKRNYILDEINDDLAETPIFYIKKSYEFIAARSTSPNLFESDEEENNSEWFSQERLKTESDPSGDEQLSSGKSCNNVANIKLKSKDTVKIKLFCSPDEDESASKLNLDIPMPDGHFINSRRKLLLEGRSDEDDDLHNNNY